MVAFTIRDIRESIKDGTLTKEVYFTFIKDFANDFYKLDDLTLSAFKRQASDGKDYLGLNFLEVQRFFDKNKIE